MKLTLSSEQALRLHELLNNETNVNDDYYDEIRETLRSKILTALSNDEVVANSKVFKTWEKKEEERIHDLEEDLNDVRNQLSDMSPSPSKPGILRRKKNKF